jgi:hypothetical protein
VAATANRATNGADVAAGQGARLVPGQPVRAVPLPAAPDLSGLPTVLSQAQLPLNIAPAGGALRVQLAADAQFARLLREWKAVAGSSLSLEGLPEGEWHVRVRTIDVATGLEGPDASRSFQLMFTRDLPPGPVTRPQTGARTPGQLTLNFTDEWPETDPLRYRVQVARDEAFTQVVWQASEVADKTLRPPLTEAGSYWWRVARQPRSATDPRGESAWSVGSFVLEAPMR